MIRVYIRTHTWTHAEDRVGFQDAPPHSYSHLPPYVLRAMAELVFHYVSNVAASVIKQHSSDARPGASHSAQVWDYIRVCKGESSIVSMCLFFSASDCRCMAAMIYIRMSIQHPQDGELPPPMLPGNWEPAQPACFFGEGFKRIVVDNSGFEYKNDATRFRGS